MKFLTAAPKIAAIVAIISLGVQPVQAQQQGDTGAGTGTDIGATAGTSELGLGSGSGSAALTTEVDTSVFGEIDRGATIGDSSAGGFGLGEQGGGSTGVGGIGGGGLGAFGGGGLGGLGALNNLFGGGFGAQGARSAKPIIRTRIRSRVKVAPVAPALVQREATTRLNQVTDERQLGGVNVQMFGRTAVLTGAVGNESDRRMSELLLRLEPGVSTVENRVLVLP